MSKKLNNPIKAVLYHADAQFGERHGKGIYKHLIEELKKNLHSFEVQLVHVTVTGHEGWGDENYFYDVENVQEVIYNREKCLLEFMRKDAVDDQVYWFCEPDFRLLAEFPPLTTDLCMLYRNDPMAMTPAWRLCKKTALPFWEEAFNNFDLSQKEWHGDSRSWVKMWEQLGSPTDVGFFTWKNLSVELRPYGWYASRHKCRFSGQWKGGSKIQIVSKEYLNALDMENKNESVNNT